MDVGDGGTGDPLGASGSVPAAGAGSSTRRPSRRWFVAGGVALVAGAGAGVGVGFAQQAPGTSPPGPPPAALRAALSDERALLAAARDAHRGGALDTNLAAALVRDHEAHLAALTAAAGVFGHASASPSASPSSSPSRAPARGREALRGLERRAATLAADRAQRLSGAAAAAPLAALLASVAACEATHAELLA